MPTVIPIEPAVVESTDSVSRTCSDCKYWNRDTKNDNSPLGLCNRIILADPSTDEFKNRAFIYPSACLYNGIQTQLITSQAFGCKLFEPKGT